MEKTLTQVYYNPANPSSFGGKEAVYIAAKTINPKITREKVDKWLSQQLTYTLHKPVRYNFKANRVYFQGRTYFEKKEKRT